MIPKVFNSEWVAFGKLIKRHNTSNNLKSQTHLYKRKIWALLLLQRYIYTAFLSYQLMLHWAELQKNPSEEEEDAVLV